MDPDEARRRFAAAQVARLATVDANGRPHLVPVTFGCDAETVYTAIDAKPKSTRHLKRIANIAANPAVALLVDHYTDDWNALWWVRADGTARVVESGSDRDAAIRSLQAKYPQYADEPPPGPAIIVTVTHWRSWAASG